MNDIKARLISITVADLGIVRLEFATTSQLVNGLVTKGNDLFMLRKIEEGHEDTGDDDDRILKGIIGIIDHGQSYGVSKADMLAYLDRHRKKTELIPGFYFITADGKKYYSKEFRYGNMKMKFEKMED